MGRRSKRSMRRGKYAAAVVGSRGISQLTVGLAPGHRPQSGAGGSTNILADHTLKQTCCLAI